jgi:hypothetical protein
MIEEDKAIAQEDQSEPVRGFPIHLISSSTSLITSILPNGSVVTVKIDRDWYSSGRPLVQVFINRNTHANLPVPVMRHAQANWTDSVGDIDNTIARLLRRPPAPLSPYSQNHMPHP